VWTSIDGVIVRQTAMNMEVAPLVEVNGCRVGRQNVKVDHLAVVLFTGCKV